MTQYVPTRRQVLRGAAATGVSSLAALAVVKGLAESAVAGVPTASATAALATSTGCATLTVSETEGPFWIDEKLNRSDIRYDTGAKSSSATTPVSGVPLTLTLTLLDAGGDCTPQTGVFVDIWHADAAGVYSDVSGSGNPDETGHNFLRGYQVSDANGQVTFTTVYPGWYVSRTIHIHLRVRTQLSSTSTVNFTSQLFFDETTNNTVQNQTAQGYKGAARRDTTNSTDQLYDASLLVPLTGSVSSGYVGAYTVNLDYGDDSTGSTDTTGTGSTGSTGTGSTSTGSTGTGSTGSSGSDTGSGGSSNDTTVSASVRRVSVKGRKVKVTVHAKERVAAKLRLEDHDDVLATKRTGWLRKGVHTATLRLPRSVDPGRYTLSVSLADRAGTKKIITKRVRVG